jgi:hypothetical protein
MKKTFKKSDINKYLKNERIDELVNKNGSLINPTNNYVQNRNHVKSRKTTDDFVRNSTQGPEAYFIYGGPYYGINYSYVVNEDDEILDLDLDDYGDDNYDETQVFGDELIDPEFEEYYDELNVVPTKKYSRDPEDRKRRGARTMAKKDISDFYNKPSDPIYDDLPVEKWRRYPVPDDTKFTDFDFDISESENSMRNLVDEIMMKKKSSSHDFVKKMREQDIVGDEVTIPDVTELKDVHEKPMVIRKLNSLLDLINKENLKGEELSILLNHLINNVDIYSMDERHREFIGDKIKYGEEEGE